MRRALAVLVGMALLAASPAAAHQAEPQTNLADISDEVMCVVCGVPLELALEAPQAQAEREFIRGLIAQGQTKDEIKDALVAEYGDNVLAIPGTEGFDLAAWVIPIVAFIAAALGIGIALRRWRRSSGSAEPRNAASEPSGEDTERLEEDIARYEL